MATKKRKKKTTPKKRKNVTPPRKRKKTKKASNARKVTRKTTKKKASKPASRKRKNTSKRASAQKRTAKRNRSTAAKPRKVKTKKAAKRPVRKGSKVAWSSGRRPRPFLVENKRKKKNTPKRRRRNGSDSGASVYKDFHGRPSKEDITLVEQVKTREAFGALGELQEVCIETPTGLNVKIPFDGKKVLLCATPDRKNLYFKGGNQSIDLRKLKMDGGAWKKDKMLLGICYEITYRTQKGFDKFRTTDYYHALGEETGVKPMLNYDALNQRLELAGGQYLVRPEGITN